MRLSIIFALSQSILGEFCDEKKCNELGGTTIGVAELAQNMTLREKYCPAGHGMVQVATMPCCHVCGQQKGSDCNSEKPCDSTLSLVCNQPTKKRNGICEPMPGRECYDNEREYKSGDDFWPNCNTQCFCIDGGIGCRSARSQDVNCREEQSLLHQPAIVPIGDSFVDRQADEEKGIKKCSVQTTQWSPCSRTCDWGFSERVTNNNDECKLDKEIMLCKMRACEEEPLRRGSRGYSRRYQYRSRSRRNLGKCQIRKGGKIRAKRADRQKLDFSGCSSKKSIQMKYCPACASAQCCPDMTPLVDHNNEKYKGFSVKRVAFKCQDGEVFHKKIMLIKRCRCNNSCKPSNPFMLSRRKLHTDMFHGGSNV